MEPPPRRLTVLMSVYNDSANLVRAIESMLGQTYSDFTFLIIDDGSSDSCLETIRRYESCDSRIVCHAHGSNVGLAASLARGVQLARTELVARMDSDDIAFPNRLERQVEFMQREPGIDILGSWALDIDAQGSPERARRVPVDHASILRTMFYVNPMIHPTVMFRKSAIMAAGSYDPNRNNTQDEDYDLWFRCAGLGSRFANIAEPLLLYRAPAAEAFTKKARYGLSGLQTRWRGYQHVRPPLHHRLLGSAVPLVLGVVPRPASSGIYRLAKNCDPRQRSGRQHPKHSREVR